MITKARHVDVLCQIRRARQQNLPVSFDRVARHGDMPIEPLSMCIAGLAVSGHVVRHSDGKLSLTELGEAVTRSCGAS